MPRFKPGDKVTHVSLGHSEYTVVDSGQVPYAAAILASRPDAVFCIGINSTTAVWDYDFKWKLKREILFTEGI